MDVDTNYEWLPKRPHGRNCRAIVGQLVRVGDILDRQLCTRTTHLFVAHRADDDGDVAVEGFGRDEIDR